MDLISNVLDTIKVEALSEITLKRRNTIYAPEEMLKSIDRITFNPKSLNLLYAFSANINRLGFKLSNYAIDVLSTMNDSDILEGILVHTLNTLKKIKGDDVSYNPMYPGFPDEVRNMPESELYLNAIIHYLSNGTYKNPAITAHDNDIYENRFMHFIPTRIADEFLDNIEKVRECIHSTEENGSSQEITIIFGDSVLKSIFDNLIGSKTSLSNDDKKDLELLLNVFSEDMSKLPEIPFKETLAFIASIYLNKNKHPDATVFANNVKTPTDVLRIYVAHSGGDITLATNTRFIALTRPQRKFYMNLLLLCNKTQKELTMDMVKRPEVWKRVGEFIHPNSFKSEKYNSVNFAFGMVRGGHKVYTPEGRFNILISEKKYTEAIELAAKNPGSFVRKLDYLLRITDVKMRSLIYTKLSEVLNDVSTPVIIQAIEHFNNRNIDEMRVVFIKGETTKIHIGEKPNDRVSDSTCSMIILLLRTALYQRFASQKEPMGKVYIDGKLIEYALPKDQRTASSTGKYITRGSEFSYWEHKTDDKDTDAFVRVFIWWTNMKNAERVDVDLSMAYYDENFNFRTATWYGDLRTGNTNNYTSIHSGDVVNGGPYTGPGVSEFIDVNMNNIPTNCRYAVMSVNSFTEQKFSELNARAGFMIFDNNRSNMPHKYPDTSRYHDEIPKPLFDPSKADVIANLASDSTHVIVCVIDLLTCNIIWADISGSTNRTTGPNNIMTTKNTQQKALYAITHMHRMSIGELLELNATARGEIVDTPEEADVVFSVENGTQFELDRFMGDEFM